MRPVVVRFSVIVALVLGVGVAWALSNGPLSPEPARSPSAPSPPSRTAPPATAATPSTIPTDCSRSLDVPDTYTPGQRCTLRVRLSYALADTTGASDPRVGLRADGRACRFRTTRRNARAAQSRPRADLPRLAVAEGPDHRAVQRVGPPVHRADAGLDTAQRAGPGRVAFRLDRARHVSGHDLFLRRRERRERQLQHLGRPHLHRARQHHVQRHHRRPDGVAERGAHARVAAAEPDARAGLRRSGSRSRARATSSSRSSIRSGGACARSSPATTARARVRWCGMVAANRAKRWRREPTSRASPWAARALRCSARSRCRADRNPEARDAAARIAPILEGHGATVALGDLSAQREARRPSRSAWW